MNLAYEIEKNEKEIVKLFTTRDRAYFFSRGLAVNDILITCVIVISAPILLHAAELMSAIMCCTIASVGIVIGAGAVAVGKMFERRLRREFLSRKTHLVEYTLTDSEFAFVSGDTRYSAPWNAAAKKFKVDKNAIYLYGDDMPLEARCIPGWSGRGIRRKELVTVLKKAGLRQMCGPFMQLIIGYSIGTLVPTAAILLYFQIGAVEWGTWNVPEKGELQLPIAEVPDGENALEAVFALTNVCTLATGEDFEKSEERRFIRDYSTPFPPVLDDEEHERQAALRTDAASRSRAEKIVADNAPFFDGFRAALSLKGFFDKERKAWGYEVKTEDDGKGGILYRSYKVPYSRLIPFIYLLNLKAQVSLEKGDLEAGISAIEDLHALGERLADNANEITEYFVGVCCMESSYAMMCNAVAVDKASVETISGFCEIIDKDIVHAPSCRERAERMHIADMCVRMIELVRDTDDISRFSWQLGAVYHNGESRHGDDGVIFKLPGYLGFALHRGKTMSRLAEIFSVVIGNGDWHRCFSDVPISGCPCSTYSKRMFIPNFFGDGLVWGLYPKSDFENCFNKGAFARLRARLVLAAAKWRKAHGGKIPPSLESLVPECLDAVPADSWDKDGRPPRYDADLGVVWSVGKKGDYDYRKTAKLLADGCLLSKKDKDVMSENAFRLDALPVDCRSAGKRNLKAPDSVLK